MSCESLKVCAYDTISCYTHVNTLGIKAIALMEDINASG